MEYLINVAYRFIKLLHVFGIIEKISKVRYSGKGISLNEYYSGSHWSRRARIKNKFEKIFRDLMEQSDMEWMEKYLIFLFYNSTHDADNVVGISKIFVDTIKTKKDRKTKKVLYSGWSREDSKKHFKGLSILYDSSLPNNTFDFYVVKLK